jgi:hypothetical protein
MSRKRLLGVPPYRSRAWVLPSLLYWERHRLARIEAEVDSYADVAAWKRRCRRIQGRIQRLEAEFGRLHEAPYV